MSGPGYRRLCDALTSRGVAVKGSKKEQDVRCPAHEDKTASLSIGQGRKGAVVHCQAGCTTGAVLSAVGLTEADLFDAKRRDGFNVVDEYSYVDESGAELFQAVRLDPKDFRQRRPDGSGGWIWNIKGVRRVLYRLPEVVAAVAQDRWVVVVEGEKDADRLHQEGIVATTNPMGAGSWAGCDSRALDGAKVAIIPDNDQPGRQHAYTVAADLTGRATVRIVNLDDLSDGGDVSTWLNNGGTIEQLRTLIINSDEWDPTQQPETDDPGSVGAWTPVDLAAVAASGLEPIQPDVFYRRDGRALFYSRKLNVIFAAPEAGKTWIAVMAVGQLVADAARTGAGVVAVFIDYEDDARSYLTRLWDSGINPEDAARHTRYYSMAQAIRTAPDDLEGLTEATLIVVDTTNSAMTLDDLDPLSNADALTFINHVRRLRNGNRAAWLLLDHEPISTGTGRRQAIGAQSKLGAVDGAQYRAAAVQQPRPGADGTISLHVTKDRAGGVREFAAKPDQHGIQHAATIYLNPRKASALPGAFDYTVIEPQGAAEDTELRHTILAVCEDWASKSQIKDLVRSKSVKRRDTALVATIDELAGEGLLDTKPKGSYVAYRTREGVHQTHSQTGNGYPLATHSHSGNDPTRSTPET